MFHHQDSLSSLNKELPFGRKLDQLHNLIRDRHPAISRIAVATYDQKSDLIKTFAYSSDDNSPLTHYQAKLSDSLSLREVVQKQRPRVINDLDVFSDGAQQHTQAISSAGYGASYTLPMFYEDRFMGFIFFNSKEKHVFDERVLVDLDMLGHMIILLLANLQSSVNTLMATVKSALDISHERDPETGCHLDRMSRYSRLITQKLAPKYEFSDEYVEHLFMFAPLHDLGKIAIPDKVLLKPDTLDQQEREIMQSHADKGHSMLDELLKNYGLSGVKYVQMLRNIVLYHHEAVDGSGYPQGLKGDDIPIEARIVTVADVFDALTSNRPYKSAWENDRAFQYLRVESGKTLDRECVLALTDHRAEIEQIQQQFQENPIG